MGSFRSHTRAVRVVAGGDQAAVGGEHRCFDPGSVVREKPTLNRSKAIVERLLGRGNNRLPMIECRANRLDSEQETSLRIIRTSLPYDHRLGCQSLSVRDPRLFLRPASLDLGIDASTDCDNDHGRQPGQKADQFLIESLLILEPLFGGLFGLCFRVKPLFGGLFGLCFRVKPLFGGLFGLCFRVKLLFGGLFGLCFLRQASVRWPLWPLFPASSFCSVASLAFVSASSLACTSWALFAFALGLVGLALFLRGATGVQEAVFVLGQGPHSAQSLLDDREVGLVQGKP